MVYMKQNITAYENCVCQQKYASQLREEKVEKTQHICCFWHAELTCEHIGRVCRCIYIQHVHAQIWPCSCWCVPRRIWWSAGGLSMTCLWHMSTAFFGTKTCPLCEAFECCQGKLIRGNIGLACHDMFHALLNIVNWVVKLQKNDPKSSWNICTWLSMNYEWSLTTSKLEQIVVKLCNLTTCSLSLPNTGYEWLVISSYGKFQATQVTSHTLIDPGRS